MGDCGDLIQCALCAACIGSCFYCCKEQQSQNRRTKTYVHQQPVYIVQPARYHHGQNPGPYPQQPVFAPFPEGQGYPPQPGYPPQQPGYPPQQGYQHQQGYPPYPSGPTGYPADAPPPYPHPQPHQHARY